jgi:hypothetical protein
MSLPRKLGLVDPAREPIGARGTRDCRNRLSSRFSGERAVSSAPWLHDLPFVTASLVSPRSANSPGSSLTRTHSCLVNGFGWQGMAAPLDPLLQRQPASFLPLGVPPIPRETRNPSVRRPSHAFRPFPTPKSITFWGPRGARAAGQAPAFNQPSRPRWARVRTT